MTPATPRSYTRARWWCGEEGILAWERTETGPSHFQQEVGMAAKKKAKKAKKKSKAKKKAPAKKKGSKKK